MTTLGPFDMTDPSSMQDLQVPHTMNSLSRFKVASDILRYEKQTNKQTNKYLAKDKYTYLILSYAKHTKTCWSQWVKPVFPIFEEKISQMWQLPPQTANDLHPVKVALCKSP